MKRYINNLMLLRTTALAVALFAAAGCAAASAPLPEMAAGARIVERPPPDTSAMLDILVGEIAAQRGDYRTAFERFMKQARDLRDPRLAERATHFGIFAEDERRAVEAAALWQELDPDNRLIDRVLANLYLRLGDADRGYEHLVRFLAAQPDLAAGFRQVTAILVRVPDKGVALDVARRLAEAHPESAEARFNHGVIARAAADLERAVAELRAALRLRPAWSAARINLAQVLTALERDEEALALLAEGVAASPEERELRMTYARLLMRANRTDEARAQFEELARRQPDDPDVLYALALLAIDAEQTDAAIGYLEQLLQFEARADDARYFLGRLEAQRENYAAALDWYRQVGGGEYHDEARIQAIAVMARQGRLDEAFAALRALREQQPQLRVRLLLVEGQLLADADRRERAMQLYDTALEESPGNEDLLFARAMLAEKMDRIDLLERDLKTVIENDPDNASALNALGYTLADRTTRYDEALAYIEKALALRPEDAAIIDSMGWVMYRLGRNEAALNYLLDAYARSRDPEIAAHLGEVLWESGQTERARKVLHEAMEAAPEHEVLKRTVERYDP